MYIEACVQKKVTVSKVDWQSRITPTKKNTQSVTHVIKAINRGKLLCVWPQVVALIISLPGHLYTFTIEISMWI